MIAPNLPDLKLAPTARAGLCAASRRDPPSPAVFTRCCALSAWAVVLQFLTSRRLQRLLPIVIGACFALLLAPAGISAKM